MYISSTFLRSILLASLIAWFLTLFIPFLAQAQFESIDIATTYIISETDPIDSGDIIVFNRETQQFLLAREPDDLDLFGVVVFEPLLVLERGEGGLPIVRTGEALVNVTALNGPIEAGDYITSSSIPGKGQRADEDDTYIIGIALDPYEGTSEDEGVVTSSAIRILLSVGTKEKAATILVGGGATDTTTGITEATILNIIQFLLAAFVAVGSLYVAFKNFGPNIRDGIVSVGRNPLARSSIQSMVILNAVLIILISAGGLFVSVAILLLPI